MQITESAGQVVAADTQASIEAIDQAVSSYSRLCASIVEVSNASNLPVSTGQAALAKVSQGLMALVEGRSQIAEATRDLLKIKSQSNLQTTAFGCPPELPKPSAVIATETLRQ